MTIPSVVQGLVETEGGKVFELDSPKGGKWLESITSFRYEPIGANKPCTIRKETKKGGDYWYAYRKVKGELHKRYLGCTAELTVTKLEEIAEALNTSQQTRVTEAVTETVTYKPADDEMAALKLQVQSLEESLEALRDEVLEKYRASDVAETPSPDLEVADNGLLIELSNLKAENEALRQELAKQKDDYAAQLAISKVFHQETQDLRAQLEAVQAEVETCRQQSTPEVELPEAAELLNRFRARYPKSKLSHGEMKAILEILDELTPDGEN